MIRPRLLQERKWLKIQEECRALYHVPAICEKKLKAKYDNISEREAEYRVEGGSDFEKIIKRALDKNPENR